MMAAKNVLMIGMHGGYARAFGRSEDFRLYCLEEPGIHRRDPGLYDGYGAAGLLIHNYQQSEDFLDPVVRWHSDVHFDAVVPAFEYGVPAARRVAEELGLRSPGRTAVEVCTDKARLREATASLPLYQPRWARVADARDVRDFYDGRPVVLKPSNRRASVGVVLVDSPAAIAGAWAECTRDEDSATVADRPRHGQFLVEEFVPGPLLTTETMVQDGEIVFTNVSLQATPAAGPYFPIVAITIPAPIPGAVHEILTRATRELIGTLAVENGTIQFEWKMVGSQPYLVEGAARVPGDYVPQLIERAYGGFEIFDAQLRILSGLRPSFPDGPVSNAAARWMTPPAGIVRSIRGAEALASDPAVFQYRIDVGPGDHVTVIRNGWQHVGYFAACDPDSARLEMIADRLLHSVVFDVDTADPAKSA